MRDFRVVLPVVGMGHIRGVPPKIAWGRLFKRYANDKTWLHWGKTRMPFTMETRCYIRFGHICIEWFTGERSPDRNIFAQE